MRRRTLGLVLVITGVLVFAGGCMALVGAIVDHDAAQAVAQLVTAGIGVMLTIYGFRTRRTAG